MNMPHDSEKMDSSTEVTAGAGSAGPPAPPTSPVNVNASALQRFWRARGEPWVDRLLVLAWLGVTLAFLYTVGRESVYHTDAIRWNTMWESAPLEVATDAARGRPIYGNSHEGPVHLAIYGPLYYQTLGLIGAAMNADNVTMIAIGRWAGIGFLALGLLGVAWFVRNQGGQWWAALAALGCAGLLTPTAMRFVASARPDAMAAALSVVGLAVTLSRKRGGVVLGAILLSAAWLTKVTAVAAPAAALFALALAAKQANPGRRWRTPALFCALMLLMNGTAVLALSLATDGWFHRHLNVASAAPMNIEYAWYMLTRKPPEPAVRFLFIFPALAALTAALVWDWSRAENAAQKSPTPAPEAKKIILTPFWVAAVYFLLALTVAVVTAMRQGSDRNYLIEPALAAGMLIGTWASAMAAARGGREWLVTRAAAAIAIFNPMALGLQDRLANCDAENKMHRDTLQPYGDDALEWARTLPQPLLSLDSWLPYRAGVANDLSDPIAYNSYCLAGGEDPVAERVRRQYYACILTMAPADGADYKIYGDIGTFWPALREAIHAHYTPLEPHGGWYVYVPKRAGEGGK